MPVATDVATLPDELANATTIFELWELTARAQAAAAQSTGDLKTSVDDVKAAHDEVISLGARLLKTTDDIESTEGYQVYADPAGHPFCLCWG